MLATWHLFSVDNQCEENHMINNCANPRCAKPLHSLREGRIFVFHLPNSARTAAREKGSHHLEHFWLCGECAQQFLVERKGEMEHGVRLVPRSKVSKAFLCRRK